MQYTVSSDKKCRWPNKKECKRTIVCGDKRQAHKAVTAIINHYLEWLI